MNEMLLLLALLGLELLPQALLGISLMCSPFASQTLPQACCLGDGNLFTSNLKQLYMAVSQQQARAAGKRPREGELKNVSPGASPWLK